MSEIREQILDMIGNIEADDAPIVLPKSWVMKLLQDAARPTQPPGLGPEPIGGYSLRDLGVAFGRSKHRVWEWLNEGRFPGAYRLMGGEWRVPREAVEAFIKREKEEFNPPETAAKFLRSWRRRR